MITALDFLEGPAGSSWMVVPLSYLDNDGSQDLKDFGREAGSVSFADIDRDFPGQGYARLSLCLPVSFSQPLVFSSTCLAMMQIVR